MSYMVALLFSLVSGKRRKPSKNSTEEIEHLDGVTETDEAEDVKKVEEEEDDLNEFNMLVIFLLSVNPGWKAVNSATFDYITNNIK